MPLSGFQVERLLRRARALRRRILGDGPPPTPADPVQVTPEAARQAAGGAGQTTTAPPYQGTGVPPSVRESDPLDPVVAYELERRAGSFMMPPHVPYPPPAGIPRLPRGGVKGARRVAEDETSEEGQGDETGR